MVLEPPWGDRVDEGLVAPAVVLGRLEVVARRRGTRRGRGAAATTGRTSWLLTAHRSVVGRVIAAALRLVGRDAGGIRPSLATANAILLLLAAGMQRRHPHRQEDRGEQRAGLHHAAPRNGPGTGLFGRLGGGIVRHLIGHGASNWFRTAGCGASTMPKPQRGGRLAQDATNHWQATRYQKPQARAGPAVGATTSRWMTADHTVVAATQHSRQP